MIPRSPRNQLRLCSANSYQRWLNFMRMEESILGSVMVFAAATLFVTGVMAQQAPTEAPHQLKPTPKTVAWGYYDAKAAPALRVKSGDTVEIQTLITNSPKRLEDAGLPPDQVEQSL